MHAAASDHCSPAVIGGDAAANILRASLFHFRHPLLVGDHLPREQDGVGIAGADEFVGDPRMAYPADQENRLLRDGLDGPGVFALPSLLESHRRVNPGVVNAGGYAHIVDIGLSLEIRVDAFDVLDFEIALPERGRIDAVSEERPIANPFANPSHCFDREPQAILIRSAPAVRTVIVEGREELPGKVAVRDVKFDAVQPGGNGALGGILVTLQNVFDLVLFQLLGRRTARNFASRHLARRQHIGIVFVGVARRIGFQERCRRTQSQMKELHRERAAVPLYRPGHIGQTFHLSVVPEAGEAEWSINRVLVYQVAAQNDHAQAGFGALFVVSHGLFGKNSFMRTSYPCRANRTEHDTVWQRGVAYPQGRQQMTIGAGVGHGRFLP